MKKILLFISLLLLSSAGMVIAQTPDYKVVFDLTSKDSTDHQMVMRWMNEISQADPTAQTEVVLYGKSLDMVVKGKSSVAAQIMKLAQNKNTAIRVCAIAMKNNHVEASQLLPGVLTVPDGIYELVKKQKEGWGYIKVSH
jgi:intracellular sulfur oxidation DsrE/DsrF family protein